MAKRNAAAPAIGPEARQKIQDTVLATVLGHQLGQTSERRWWRNPPDGCEAEVHAAALLDEANMKYLIDDPPIIETPGWVPTCFEDTAPHLCALSGEFARLGHMASPEEFRDFLLNNRGRFRLQGVGRSCAELMAEGMNPRIAGLFAPSVVSGCWVAWPVALYDAGYPGDAYEDAVRLARTQSGGDIVELAGLLAALLAGALMPGATWGGIKSGMLGLAEKRCGPALLERIRLALDIGASATSLEDWMRELRSEAFKGKVRIISNAIDWMSSWYAGISALEFCARHAPSWPDFARGILSCCGTRFGAMIAFSVRAALEGVQAMPDVWLRHCAAVHACETSAWADGACALLAGKLAREGKNARELLKQFEGEIENTRFFDKTLAAMLAGAAGNAMGSPVEDRDYPWIEERYGVLDRVLDPKRLETEDDSAMARMWADTYIRCGGRIYPEDLAETFRSDMKPENFYYDSQHAYALMMQGVPAHACGHWNVVTGSGLMGSYPCGIYHAGDPQGAAADALELAYHYQRGFDAHAPAILCAAAAEALRDGATVASVLKAAVRAAPREPQEYFGCKKRRDARKHLRGAIAAVEGCDGVLAARKPLYAGFLEYNGQDPWEVVSLTLGIFKAAKGDVWQSMIGGTNIGRDSDTISSQAAVLSACLSGMKGVPSQVLGLISGEKLESYRSMARGMAELARSKCLSAIETAKKLGLSGKG